MDFTKIPLIRQMTARLQWLGQRQQVLAKNVVNVDTPGYRAKDLEEGSFRRVLAGEITRPVMKVTHAGHIRSSRSSGAAEIVERRSEDGKQRERGEANGEWAASGVAEYGHRCSRARPPPGRAFRAQR